MENDIRKNIDKFQKTNSEIDKWINDILETNVNIPFTISESTLNRIEQWIREKDIAGITAFRDQLIDTTPRTRMDFPEKHKYTQIENKKRNTQLRASLHDEYRYGLTPITGSFIEDDKRDIEKSFIVVNLNNDPNFKHVLLSLGELFNQDSVLFKDKNSNEAYVIGTNDSKDPGFGVKKIIGTIP